MGQFAFRYDETRCTGCKTCVLACKDAHNLDVGVAYRRVYECVGGETKKDEVGCCTTTCFSYYVSVACNHCDSPVCVEVCPTGAMHKSAETGIVSVDAQKCIGCGYCHLSCPYNAPQVDKTKGHSVKCDGCAERVAQGKAPVCVLACPARALGYGDAEQAAAWGERADVAPLPPASETEPNLYLRPCRDARPSGSADVQVGNVAEVQ